MFSNSETGGLIQCPEIISAFMKEFKVNKNIYYVTLNIAKTLLDWLIGVWRPASNVLAIFRTKKVSPDTCIKLHNICFY
jgi:hypothetical protein